MGLSLNQPKGLGTALAKVFFGIGLTLPLVTGVLSILFIPLGLMNQAEVYPWDQVLSILFLLALFVTPESICVYLFQSKVIKRFLARMAFVILVVFLYANYVLLPPSIYTFLPVTAATLLWVAWPPLCTLVLGLLVGKIESRRLFSSGSVFKPESGSVLTASGRSPT